MYTRRRLIRVHVAYNYYDLIINNNGVTAY